MLYSEKGIYVLFDGTDKTLTATMREDFLDLWTEDVFECFFWTDEKHPIYFEYEISPLGHELPILIPNLDGTFLGWRPWHYEGDEKRAKRWSRSTARASPMPRCRAGEPRFSFHTTCSSRWGTCLPSPARIGVPTSIAWITTTATPPAGTGRAWAPASTSFVASEQSCLSDSQGQVQKGRPGVQSGCSHRQIFLVTRGPRWRKLD